MKKVLIITYYWPPAGGPGVQRVLKFAKYLPEFGWQPVILTVKNGEYPAYDESLRNDIPDSCKVYKTPALEPFSLYKKFTGMAEDEQIPTAALTEKKTNWKKKVAHWIRLNIFVPDAKIGWIPFAVKAGKHIIQKENPDIIFSSSPPPTVHLIAKSLARWSRIKWVADFRDPWTEIHYYNQEQKSKLANKIDYKLENSVVNSSDFITCASQQFIKLIGAKNKNNAQVITNGYDRDEFESEKLSNNKFSLLHVGGININRFYPKFYHDFAELIGNGEIDKQEIELIFIGKVSKNIKNLILESFEYNKILKYTGYLPHDEALQHMQRGNVLLLFMENVENYTGHIPGKLFEYIATGNTVLGIGEPGDAEEILQGTKAGHIYSPDSDFKKIIAKKYRAWKKSQKVTPDWKKISNFSRKNLTKVLAEIFENIK